MVHPVAQAVWMRLVYLRDSYIDAETFVGFHFKVSRIEDDAYGQDVVDFFERDVFGLHLVPNGIRRLDTCQDAILDAHLVQLGADRGSKLTEQFFAFVLGILQQCLDVCIFFRMFVLEAEVFQLSLYLVQS